MTFTPLAVFRLLRHYMVFVADSEEARRALMMHLAFRPDPPRQSIRYGEAFIHLVDRRFMERESSLLVSLLEVQSCRRLKWLAMIAFLFRYPRLGMDVLAEFKSGAPSNTLKGVQNPQLARPELILRWFKWFIPRQYRGEAIEDLLEEAEQMRELGMSSSQVNLRILWQVFFLILAHARVWRAAVVGWVFSKLT